MRNNAVRYTDPTGHEVCNADGWCGEYDPYYDIQLLSQQYGINFTGKWSTKDKLAVLTGAIVVAGALSAYTGLASIDSFSAVFGSLTFVRSTQNPAHWAEYGQSTITFFAGAKQWTSLVAHELGHAFNAAISTTGGVTPYNTLYNNGIFDDDGIKISGYVPNYTVSGTGYTCNGQCFDSDGTPIPPNRYRRSENGYGFQHNRTPSPNEDFADMFANWATRRFTNHDHGRAMLNFMTTNLSEWVNNATGR